MAQHLIDTAPTLAECSRCGAYVYACQVSGTKVMADPTPLAAEAYRAVLLAGGRTYRILYQAGMPWRLKSSGWTGGDLVGDHGCGTRAMNHSKLGAIPVGPHRAPARSTTPAGALHPQAAPVGPQAAVQSFRSPARSVRSCPSDTWAIDYGEIHFCEIHDGART